MDLIDSLKEIGLTEAESKVYLALLKLGLSSKGALIKEAKVAPSKIYHLLDKLCDKGLVSIITKDNIRHYSPAPVHRIKDYLEAKKKRIEEQEKSLHQVLRKFEELSQAKARETKAEIFFGWTGMETAYSTMVSSLKKGQEIFILGASSGTNPERTKDFYIKYSLRTLEVGAKTKLIFDENSREYVKAAEEETGIIYTKRFLQKTAPVEVAITSNLTGIVILKEEPIVILIQDKETAEGFITYFKELWKIAKP